MDDIATGSCLCGAVRFAARLPSKWVAHCHCSMCRRAHGAAFVTWAGFEDERIAIEDADARLQWHASSPPARRGFCARCGSTLFFRSERWPGELHVVLANFDTPLDRLPQAHVFYDAHVPWFEPNDDLPRKP
jgi:hypothetical protein